MTSQQLKTFGFHTWHPIPDTELACRNLILRLPRVYGVYILKANHPLKRLSGNSDLIYIGHGKIQTRLQNLMISFLPTKFKNYSTKHSAYREFTRIMKETALNLSLGYIQHPSKEEARAFESDLLQHYCRDHIEPPPLNNTRR